MTNIRDLLKIAGVTLLGIVLTSSGSLFAASGRPGGAGASHGSHSGGGFHSGSGSHSSGSFGTPRTSGVSHSGIGSHSSSGFSGSSTPRFSAPRVSTEHRSPAVRETRVQRPSTPAVREVQRPSAPAVREIQRPSTSTVRETPERPSAPSVRQNPQVQQANERVPGASRQVQRPNVQMERNAERTSRPSRQATEQREARQPARVDRTADSGTSGGQPHYSGGQRVTEQPASGTERQAGKRPVAPERRSGSVQPGNRPSQRSTNSHADRAPASKAPATGERVRYEGGKRVVEPAPGTERQAGKRNNPPVRPNDINGRPGSRPGIAPVAPSGKPYPRPNVPAYPGHHPGPGPGPGYVEHHHHHHPAPPPPAPYRHYYPYHYYPYYSYPRYSWWVDVANFGIGFVTGYAYGSAYPYYYYYPTYYTTTTYPVSSGDTVIIQDNTIVVADDAANGNVANNVEAVPVAEPQVAQADDPKAVSILDKDLNEDLNVPAEDPNAVAKPAVDEKEPLSEEEAAKAAALQAELAKITKESVDSAWETLQKSDELFGQGKIDEAVTGYEKVAKEMRLMPDTYFRLSVADVAKGNYKDAIDQLNQGMEMSKNWPSSPFTLDYMYRERTDQKKADLAKLERMAVEWSDKADVQLLAGMMLYMDGQAEKATPYLQKAQSLDKNLENITKPLLENIEKVGTKEGEKK